MSSSEEEEDIDSENESYDGDNQLLSENSSDEEDDPEHISSTDDTATHGLNHEIDERSGPETFSVNLHEIQNDLKRFHPESSVANYKEIQLLTRIKRHNGIINDVNHKTLPILTKYERTKILGQRAKQIEDGDNPHITIDNIIDPYIIASMELTANKIPFIIRRPLPNGSSEYWKISDLLSL